MTAWPQPDPTWHKYAAEWFSAVGEIIARPTPAAAEVAAQWAAAFSARLAADLHIPIEMVHEGEEAVGVRGEMHRHPSRTLVKLVYGHVVPADYFTAPQQGERA
jgi:hypothetical protein